jgi:pimeloyl-ACP methyl ester carboxylesterase
MPTRHDLRFDVTDAVHLGEPAHITGTLFVPDRAHHPLTIALLVPGGGFTRRYYDLDLPGHEDYSAALYLAERGIVAVAIDSLGTGESSVPDDGRRVTLDISAAALGEVARQLRTMAAEGRLDLSLPVDTPFLVGIGHSLGGCTMTLQQGADAACDAVAILGFSCQYIQTAIDPKTGQRLRPRIPSGNGYNRSDPATHRDRFYTASVPIAVIEAEEAGRVAMPDGVAEVLIPGRSAPAAARIEVPVLLGFGEFDVSPDPWKEPGYYTASRDVTLLLLADAAHCHNSASGRVGFWRRIGDWIETVARDES